MHHLILAYMLPKSTENVLFEKEPYRFKKSGHSGSQYLLCLRLEDHLSSAALDQLWQHETQATNANKQT